MSITRRDLLWSLGGGLAGATLTPVPWKLLDDRCGAEAGLWVVPSRDP